MFILSLFTWRCWSSEGEGAMQRPLPLWGKVTFFLSSLDFSDFLQMRKRMSATGKY